MSGGRILSSQSVVGRDFYRNTPQKWQTSVSRSVVQHASWWRHRCVRCVAVMSLDGVISSARLSRLVSRWLDSSVSVTASQRPSFPQHGRTLPTSYTRLLRNAKIMCSCFNSIPVKWTRAKLSTFTKLYAIFVTECNVIVTLDSKAECRMVISIANTTIGYLLVYSSFQRPSYDARVNLFAIAGFLVNDSHFDLPGRRCGPLKSFFVSSPLPNSSVTAASSWLACSTAGHALLAAAWLTRRRCGDCANIHTVATATNARYVTETRGLLIRMIRRQFGNRGLKDGRRNEDADWREWISSSTNTRLMTTTAVLLLLLYVFVILYYACQPERNDLRSIELS